MVNSSGGSGETIADRSYRTIVETFSIWAGIIFVVSGGINAVSFWLQFRMNYFDIAQPSDIVMSAFVNVFIFLAFVAVMVVVLYTILAAKDDKARGRATIAQRPTKRSKLEGINWIAGVAAVAVGTVQIVKDWERAAISLSKITAVVKPPSYWDRPLTMEGVSGLHLSKSSDQFAACGQGPVLWMGSATVIVNCRGRLRVVQNTENLLLERLSPSESDALIRQEAARLIAAKAQPERVPVPAASPKASGR